jgi:hypothetical protein
LVAKHSHAIGDHDRWISKCEQFNQPGWQARVGSDVVVMTLLRRNCVCASNADADSDRGWELSPLDINRIY